MQSEAIVFGVIGGTGLTSLTNLDILRRDKADTPYGDPSSALTIGKISGRQVAFLARHGDTHNIPPHKVNYRANLWALKSIGVKNIIAVNAVGGIGESMVPGSLVIPDQIIDYTRSRTNTFFETELAHVTHIDFSYPYHANLSQAIKQTADASGITVIQGATYAATEGPRLETAAEIQRLKKDGCDIVGMTGMPETALARELEINYVSICVNANWGAGLSDELITMEAIEKNLLDGMQQVRTLLSGFLSKP
jgi:5'-methylthioinosine phosphorylase